jgi:hypothetical protein
MNNLENTIDENTVKTTIASFWAEDEKTVTAASKEKRLKALRREAEIAVAGLGAESDRADTALETAIRDSFKGTSPVDELFKLKRQAKIAKAKHVDALADYEEFFGEAPRLQ